MSIASMVLGIVAVVFSCCTYWITFPCAIIGIILAALSMKNKMKGKNMAIAGLVMCIVSVAFGIIAIITAGALLASMPFIADLIPSNPPF